MNGLCKAAIIIMVLIALAVFIMPSSAQLTSNSGFSSNTSNAGYGSNTNNTSISGFSSFSGSGLSFFDSHPPLPGIFNGLGGWTGFGLGGIGGWGRGWCGGWSSAIVGLGCWSGPRELGYFGCSPPIIPAGLATAPTPEKGIANAPISSEKGIGGSSS